jgi:hypothetical protein
MREPLPHEALARAARAAFGGDATVLAADPLSGDASTRRYVRLRLAGAGVPATAVAMLLGEGRFAPGSDEIGGGVVIDELPFVNVGRWFAGRGFAVPAVYHDGAEACGLLLLEDIGDTTLWSAATRDPAGAPALFDAAVDLLVAIQAAAARHPDPACYAFRRRFDGALARWELEHFVEHGIETRHGRALPPAERTALLAALAPIAAPFEDATPDLCHRDFMAWNLHVQDGRLRLIDFQDALLGPGTYDLAALLTDRSTGELVTAPLEAALIERFKRGRAAAGLSAGDDLGIRYRQCALHRALKVIGRFYFLERVKQKPGYLAYLPAVYAVARRMFAALPALATLQAQVATHVPELAPERRS